MPGPAAQREKTADTRRCLLQIDQIKLLDHSPALGDRVQDVLEEVTLQILQGVEVDVQRVVMAVGRFLNSGVIPSSGIHVVGPGLHLVSDSAEAGGAIARQTADQLVDDRDRLSTGQFILRSEGVVALALEDAHGVQQADVLIGEATVEVLEDIAGDGLIDLDLEQLRNHGRKLLAGHNAVRVKLSVTGADQNAGLGHHGDGFVCPVILADVGEGLAGLVGVLRFRLIGHERVDDLSSLGTGERVVRADIAVVIANNVCIMVRILQADAERRVNGQNVKIRQLANRELRDGLVLHTSGLLLPGSREAVRIETILLAEDRNTVGGGSRRDDLILVLVVEHDLSTFCKGAPRGLHNDQIVGQVGENVAECVGNDTGGLRRLHQRSDVFGFCDIFIRCKRHDRQQADDHDQSEKHAEQFAGFFHGFHSFNKCT